MKLRYIVVACLASLAAYVCIYAFWVKKPVTFGWLHDSMLAKYGRLASLKNVRKLVILAGSNGRYSHSAKVFSEKLGINAVNMSIAASISVPYQIEQIKPYLSRGDIVYLPLETFNYCAPEKSYLRSTEGFFNLLYDKHAFFQMDIKKQYYAFSHTNIDVIVEDAIEKIMVVAGIKKRDDLQNEYGDQIGHTPEIAKKYKKYLKSQWHNYKAFVFDPNSYGTVKIGEFLKWAKERGITVIGGLPTTPTAWKIDDSFISALKDFYLKNGQKFVELPCRSQYGIEAFFDTTMHLNEKWQKIHSESVCDAIKQQIEMR